MKLFANKKLFKKIVILLVTITLVNALIPLHMVSADADEDFGGSLFRPIFRFFAGIGDLLVRGLQWIFIGSGDIKVDGKYQIRYSPGVIFSNEVPGLDANFMNPRPLMEVKELGEKEVEISRQYYLGEQYEQYNMISVLNDQYGFDINLSKIESGNVENLYWNEEYSDFGPCLEFVAGSYILRSGILDPRGENRYY